MSSHSAMAAALRSRSARYALSTSASCASSTLQVNQPGPGSSQQGRQTAVLGHPTGGECNELHRRQPSRGNAKPCGHVTARVEASLSPEPVQILLPALPLLSSQQAVEGGQHDLLHEMRCGRHAHCTTCSTHMQLAVRNCNSTRPCCAPCTRADGFLKSMWHPAQPQQQHSAHLTCRKACCAAWPPSRSCSVSPVHCAAAAAWPV